MYSNYPEAYNQNCNINEQIPCKNSNNFCKKTSTKFIYNKNKSIPKTNYNPNPNYYKNSDKKCKKYKRPVVVLNNDNVVKYTSTNSHSWSNQRGYGNIVIASNDTCNNIHGTVNPWNRIPLEYNKWS